MKTIPIKDIYPIIPTAIIVIISIIIIIIMGIIIIPLVFITAGIAGVFAIIFIFIFSIIIAPFKMIGHKTSIILNPQYKKTHMLMTFVPGTEFITTIYNRYFNKKTKDTIKENITIWSNKK